MKPLHPTFPAFRRPRRDGFSMVELLTVIAVMAVLGALVGVSTGTGTDGRRVEAAGLRAAEMLELARQNAMSRDVMTAVVLADATASRPQMMALYELPGKQDGSTASKTDWTQITRWEAMPTGVVIDDETLRPGTETFTPGPPSPVILKQTIGTSSFSYAVFLPNGSLLSDSSPSVRVAAGRWNSSQNAVSAYRLGSDGAPENFFKVTVIAATGRIKIDRR